MNIESVKEKACDFYLPCNYSYQKDFTEAHALAKILYRLNIGKNYYGFVINLPYSLNNFSDNKVIYGLKKLGIKDKNVHNHFLKGLKNKSLSRSDYRFLFNACYQDLDEWAYSQWEGYPEHNLLGLSKKMRNNTFDKSKQYRKMRKTNLKEFYYLRYNQAVVVLGKKYDDVLRASHSFINKLHRFEKIDVNLPKVVDLRKSVLSFQNYNITLIKKGDRYIVKSRVTKERCQIIKNTLKKQFVRIIKSNNKKVFSEIKKHNEMIDSFKKTFRYATCVNDDFSKIARELDVWCYHKLSRDGRNGYKKDKKDPSKRYYRGYEIKTLYYTKFFAPHMKRR